ncbi:AMP-binding protein [Actinomadura atramentaria]|uniref:AMP-binding protein n=1 Tax=Actinomadura atramentaria TaxID=1990 RepID=UPI0003662A8D|nr:AMP-binding protein [Actinomadura atramentaria]
MEMRPVPGWGTIPRMLRDRADRYGDAVVVAADGVRLTLAGLRARARDVARALLAAGAVPGDRVALWAPNTPDWVVAAFGVWDAGAIVTPVSTRFRGLEAAAQLRATGARILLVAEGFMDTSYLSMLAAATGGPDFPELPDLRHVVLLNNATRPGSATRPNSAIGTGGADGTGGAGRVVGVIGWDSFLADGARVGVDEAERRALAVGSDDLAEIMATSGTTGDPKGVMLHHEQLLRGYWDWAEVVTLGPGDRYPVIAPFSHGFGLNAGLLACVLRRATMTPVAVFRPDALLDLIERHRVSVLAGAPPMFFRVLEEIGDRDLASLRVAICGAAAVPPELIRRLVDRVGLERMINAYGLMEGTVVSMTRAGDPVEVVAATTGRAMPGVTLRVTGDDGRDLPPGTPGEILVGGYGVMRGYWRDPERTAEAVDADGWLHTGDIGTLDEHGNLAIVDRKKEMFISSGFNAYPAEIESLLLRCGLVGEVAVIGRPDDRAGEVAWAFVVPPPGTELDAAGITAWARENMANYKVPRRVVGLTALPLNANGKVDRQALRRRAEQA